MTNEAGTSAVQASRNFVKDTGAGASPPPEPVRLTGIVNGATVVSLNWASGGGSTADYIIAYQTGATAPADCSTGTVVAANAINGTSKSVTGLTASTQYSFRVCAIDNAGTPNVSSGVTITKTTNAVAKFPFGRRIENFYNPLSVAVDANDNFYAFNSDGTNCNIRKFDSSGNQMLIFGTAGTAAGEFDCGSYNGKISVDTDGNILYVDSSRNIVQKFDSSGYYLSSFGSTGAGDGQLDQPSDIELDANGNIYVIDWGNNRVQKFNSAGVFQSKFGSTGTGNGQFTNPTLIKFDNSGNIYVSDNTQRLQKFNSSGVYQTTFGGAGANAAGLFSILGGFAVVPSGKILAFEADFMKGLRFAADTTFEAFFADTGGQTGLVRDAAMDSSGNIYTADSDWGRIQKFNSSGTHINSYGGNGLQGNDQFSQPQDIFIDSSGYMYTADVGNGRIQKHNIDTTYSLTIFATGTGVGKFEHVASVTADSSGNIYVSDDYQNKILKFASNGNYVTEWGSTGTAHGEFTNQMGIAASSTGIYVADPSSNRVQKFDFAGNYVSRLGDPGDNGGSGSAHGSLSAPFDVAVDINDKVYVADYLNNRIEIFEANGTYSSTVSVNGPEKVSVDVNGNIYVFGNVAGIKKLFVFNSAGVSQGIISVGASSTGFDVDSNGYIYITDYDIGKIYKYDSAGVEQSN